MADAIVSAVAEQLISTVKEQIQQEIKLVRGVEKELLDLSDKLKNVRNVLEDADMKQFKEKTVKDWLHRLEQTSYEMEDVLEEWNYAIIQHNKMESESESESAPKHKVCSFIPSSCFSFKKLAFHRDIANKVQHLKSKLDGILNEKDIHNFVISQPKRDPSPASWRVQSTSLIDSTEVQGRKEDVGILVNKLTAHGELGYQILSIVGAGGLGKTTLAQLVYNDSQVKQCFDLRVWVCVSDPFDLAVIAKGIIKAINDQSSLDTIQLDVLLNDLIGCISGKRVLLVLDDVWTEEYEKWEPLKNALKCGGAGTKILVTTRKEKVARIMGTTVEDIHHLELLSDEDCWLILMRKALYGRGPSELEKFQEIGKEIAKKCNGLPLAAKTLGSILCFKETIIEWDNVLKSEMWGLEQVEVELFPHLLLSYQELSPSLKRCFSYCAFFPKDMELEVEELIRSWMALGYLGSNNGSAINDMELKGREYFEDLAMRSLFQDFEKDYLTEQIRSCEMHDIIHDFAQFLMENTCVEDPRVTNKTCHVCNASLVSRAKKYRSLVWTNESFSSFCDYLASLRVLRFRGEWMSGRLEGMNKLIHLRWLDISYVTLPKECLQTICKLYFLQILRLKYCSIEEIPGEIGNLVQLRHLDLNQNPKLKELPESMRSLIELKTLIIKYCEFIKLPQGLAKLHCLRSLDWFHGGIGFNKFGFLKNLNSLSGSLEIFIHVSETNLKEIVEDIREAELKNKVHLLEITFNFVYESHVSKCSSSSGLDIIEAMEPHHNLQFLTISEYQGLRFPHWISSPINLLKEIRLLNCSGVSSLPLVEKLPFLEDLWVEQMEKLKVLGADWLGIRGKEKVVDVQYPSVVFPKLKKLSFSNCHEWLEWEDITVEEEESTNISVMPCLTKLGLVNCLNLKMLPHCLLRKISSLQRLDISWSSELKRCYSDKNGSPWKSISLNNPQLQLLA